MTKRVLCSVRTEEKTVALTFDDGPNPDYTPLLLTKLAEYRVPATFFLLGRNLERHPEIGRRIVQEGHEVGNHTYHHRILPFLSKAEIRNELESTQQLIADLLDVRPVFLRPPNGLFTGRVLDVAEQLGYRVVVGDVFPLDFAMAGAGSHHPESAAAGSTGVHHHSPRRLRGTVRQGQESDGSRPGWDHSPAARPRVCVCHALATGFGMNERSVPEGNS